MKKSHPTCRCVVLRHESHGETHFDLMIEAGAALATWQFASSPAQLAAGGALSCRRLADHRVAYLDYDGPVGGDRGHVTREDSGSCTVMSQTDAVWQLDLHGQTMRGSYTLVRRDCVWTLVREQR